MFAKVENGVVTEWPLGEYIIKATHSRTSFPSPISDEALTQFGFARFVQVSPAAFDAEFQEAKEITPVLNNGVATQAWEIVEKYTADEKAAYIAKRDADRQTAQTVSVRAQRNGKLKDSDWTQVADAPVDKAAWATYRQTLRDITAQPGFPWTVTWPTQP